MAYKINLLRERRTPELFRIVMEASKNGELTNDYTIEKKELMSKPEILTRIDQLERERKDLMKECNTMENILTASGKLKVYNSQIISLQKLLYTKNGCGDLGQKVQATT